MGKGRLKIFSHDGYAVISENGRTYRNRSIFFEGTLVNITLKCDEDCYKLVNEANDDPLF